MAALDIAQNFRRALAMVGIVIRGSADEADTASPTISTGTGVPSSSEPPGSIYLRQSTTAATSVYVTTTSGTWVALPAGAGTASALSGTAIITTETDAAGVSTAAAGTDAASATALPSGTAKVYPTTGADDAKGVIVSATDNATGRMFLVGNGVSNKILKVYPPSGGNINGLGVNSGYSSASGKGVWMYCLASGGSSTWLATG